MSSIAKRTSVGSPLGSGLTIEESVTELGLLIAMGVFPPSRGLNGGPQIYMSVTGLGPGPEQVCLKPAVLCGFLT